MLVCGPLALKVEISSGRYIAAKPLLNGVLSGSKAEAESTGVLCRSRVVGIMV